MAAEASEAKEAAPQEPAIKLANPVFSKVDKLHPAAVGFNLIVKVGEIKPIMNRLNLDGSELKISEAIIGDSTASIILSLRNDQIDMVKEGDSLILRNAKIDMVKNGFMRVAIDRWGLIEKVTDSQSKEEINLENNLSKIEYELVKEQTNDDYGRGGRRGRGRGRRGRGRGRRM